MIITFDNRDFEVTTKDRILFNGMVYVLYTQSYDRGIKNPIIEPALFNELLQNGVIKLSEEKYHAYTHIYYDVYEFTGKEVVTA